MEITKYYEVLICNLISSSSKQLEIIIKKYSLFFQVLLFGKSFCFSDKNRFYFENIIFLRMELGN